MNFQHISDNIFVQLIIHKINLEFSVESEYARWNATSLFGSFLWKEWSGSIYV